MLNTNEVRIETCTLCNYSCIFCPHSTKFNRKKEVMSLDTYCFIIDKIKVELPNITHITISGFGESFIDDTILKKIEYTRKLGYKVYIVSNGCLLSRSKIEFLNDIGIEDIRISLHSIEYKAYKKLTNASSHQFNHVVDNIQMIIERTEIPLILTFEIIPGINDDQIEKIKECYDDSAIIEMWKPHNWVTAFKYREGQIIRRTCGRPWKSPYQIQVDGTVNMCCFDFNGELLLGNFLTQTMKEIFTSHIYLDLKSHHKNGTLNQTDYICKDCDQRKYQGDIILYNNKFNNKDRLSRTSTNYAKLN